MILLSIKSLKRNLKASSSLYLQFLAATSSSRSLSVCLFVCLLACHLIFLALHLCTFALWHLGTLAPWLVVGAGGCWVVLGGGGG